jgi:hypothetical protein
VPLASRRPLFSQVLCPPALAKVVGRGFGAVVLPRHDHRPPTIGIKQCMGRITSF